MQERVVEAITNFDSTVSIHYLEAFKKAAKQPSEMAALEFSSNYKISPEYRKNEEQQSYYYGKITPQWTLSHGGNLFVLKT